MKRPLVEPVSLGGAACTIYRDAPSWEDKRTAAIGTFMCESASAGATLLSREIERLAKEDFEAVIGPMDGDTWHSYRLVSETDQSPTFFLEPVSGPFDLEAFQSAGFAPISSYVSACAHIDEAIGEPAPQVQGMTITPWDGQNAEALIGSLFDLSRDAFANNAFYKPITREAFLELYQPIIPAIDPQLVFFAHTNGQLVGYLFAMPNLTEGEKPTTAIVKTYASGIPGVGRMLVDRAHRTFGDLGYTHVIHALMHVDNASRERSQRHHGTVFRRYDLMGRELAQKQ
ncbi:MAG: hypothetical protein ACR2PG_14495 [Hyphomicrobiaceae bacterium]